MRNSVKRASKEMNHVVNANEYFEIDSHEMSKTHLQLSHTHTLTHIRSNTSNTFTLLARILHSILQIAIVIGFRIVRLAMFLL